MDRFLTVNEAAEILRLTPWTVRKAIREGRIKAFKVGSGQRSVYRINAIEIQRMQDFDLREFNQNLNK